MYLIVSGMINRNSTQYMKIVPLVFKAIFFRNSTLNRIVRLIETIEIKESFSNILQNVLLIGGICLQIKSLGEK